MADLTLQVRRPDLIFNQSVIDSVQAKIQQHRKYSEHWNLYMNTEQRDQFGDSCAVFIEACNLRRRMLER